jgi:hypothetical protein
MKNLSLKLKDEIYSETEKVIKKLKIPRNSYINKAIEHYNKVHKRSILKKKLKKESLLVAQNSMEILAEFENIED